MYSKYRNLRQINMEYLGTKHVPGETVKATVNKHVLFNIKASFLFEDVIVSSYIHRSVA